MKNEESSTVRIPQICVSLQIATFLSVFLALPCFGQTIPAPAAEICADGPYLMSRKDSFSLLRVIPRDGVAVLVSEKWSASSNRDSSIDVHVGQPSPAQFSVPVRRQHVIPASQWPMPDRILVTSDLEGNFDAFVRILRSQKAVDEELNWSFGDGHLVILGDSVDRGNYVPQCLWLIYKLEAEAQAAGGAVHMILGNHEVMNLQGDDRYLAPKYRWLLIQTGASIDLLYNDESELGRWLRSKNAVERIGDLLFVHAGIGPELLAKELSVDQINERVRSALGDKPLNSDQQFMIGNDGPLWYRGLVTANGDKPKAQNEHVTKLLTHFNASRVLVGHTIVEEISTDYDSRVVRVDVKHPDCDSTGKVQALLIESGQFFLVSDDDSKSPIR